MIAQALFLGQVNASLQYLGLEEGIPFCEVSVDIVAERAKGFEIGGMKSRLERPLG